MKVVAAILAISISSCQSPPSAALLEPELTMSVSGGMDVLTVEEYTAGVVAAEVPYTFHPHALMAQAVAARTYVTYCLAHPIRAHDDGADVCADPAHCAGFVTEAMLAERYGAEYAEAAMEASRGAAEATAGEILTCGGAPIQAVWHASSDGATASSGEIWSDVAYLQSVKSPEKAEISAAEFTMAEVKAILGGDFDGKKNLRRTLTPSGRCESLTIGNLTLTGSEVRRKFGLRSTDFTVRWRAGKLCFAVHGYGHGVGMSQRGAEAMTQAGADYREILTHYYTSAVIEKPGRG